MTKRPPASRPPKGYRRRSLGSASPPSDVRKADLFVILQAWIDAEIAHPGDQRAIMAAIDSAVQRCEGGLRLTDVWADIPSWLQPFFGRQDQGGLHAIIGRWDDLVFRPGLAGLTETEARVYSLHLAGWTDWEIQREMTPGHRRRVERTEHGFVDRSQWISIKTVYNHISSANRKMRGLFDLKDAPSGIS